MEATWRLVDQMKNLRRNHPLEQKDLMASSRRFKAALQEESIWRVSMTGAIIETIMEAGQMR